MSGPLTGHVEHFLPIGLGKEAKGQNVWCVIYCNSFHVFSSFYMIKALLPVLTLVWPSSVKSDLPKWIANGIITVAPTWHHSN